MIVSELIEALKRCDPKATVWVPDWSELYSAPSGVRGVRPTEPGDWEYMYDKPATFDGGVILVC